MRYENPRPIYPNELYHHGIMGQHWGETNGPPYPLGSGTHNRVVRQGREERKQLKAAYKDARQDVRNSAHQLLAARKDVNKYGSSGNAKKQAIAKDASARAKFYEKQYKQSLEKYKDAAAKAGKSVKYNDKSLKRAAFLAGNYNATGVLAEHAFGLVGAAIANRANNNSIKRWAAGKEANAKFDRFANQKNYKANKDSAKEAYKAQRTSGARHTGNSVSSDRINAVNYLVRYGIPKATAQKVVSGKDKDSLADMMKDAYKNPQLLTMGANKLSASQLERHLYG